MGESQCHQLWKDIVRAGSSDELEAHFVGSVVYIERGLYTHSDVPQLLVIDGQQRLTTTTLLIAALISELKTRQVQQTTHVLDGTNSKKLKKYYLCNDAEEGDLFYKLVLTKADDQYLRRIVDGEPIESEATSRVAQNYVFFANHCHQCTNEELNEVYRGLQKLIIVDIALDRDKDNPQLIFESLNSTGLDLSQSDLIRNYVLMGLDRTHQERLYDRYWYPMEQDFGHGEYSWLFNQFIRDYLTLKTSTPPRVGEVYEAFKKYIRHSQLEIEDIIRDVKLHAGFYVAFALEKETDPTLLRVFQDLNAYKVEVSYPFILELYHDYDNGILSQADFIESVRLVESYVFRRYVCSIPTNSLNKTFASFGRNLTKSHYLESIKAEFKKLTSYRRFPLSSEFCRALETKDMYHVRSKTYWLTRLENAGKKEPIHVNNYTIEHVLPQGDLPLEWQEALGEDWEKVHEEMVHTIGNLTLTGYNSELSNRSYIEKRDMKGGFACSPLSLNHTLAHHDTWNKDKILERTDILSKKMCEVWPYPDLDEAILAKYQMTEDISKKYTLSDHPYVDKGASQLLYRELRSAILALDDNIREEFKKLYIAFKLETNVVDVIPQATSLRLIFNCKFTDIRDPHKRCRDVTHIGRWGNGDVELRIHHFDDIAYAVQITQQVIDLQVQD
ncbi:hypothetical protein JCM19233_3515 [Vibrio astriarenae]|nr:hypothetical protein JCM19233_3515 [Vibrio sp. C7]